jgi:tetratricopeptide (TPR) repeat protein
MEDAASLVDGGRKALEADGDLIAARQWFEAAYREAERAGDIHAMADAALGLAGIWVHEHRTAAAAGLLQARLEHVLARLEPGSTLALRVRIRLAGEADYREGRHDRILALLNEARAGNDPVTRAEALSLAHHCLLGPDHGDRRRALADELIGEGARSGRRSDLLMGLIWQLTDMVLDADPHAERRLSELRGMLADENHLAIAFVVNAMEVMLNIRAGRFEEAEHLAKECAERGAEAGDADATAWYGAQMVAIRWYQGRLPELLPLLSELVHSPTLSEVDNSFFAGLALAAAMAGDQRTAASALATLRGKSLGDLPRSSSWLVMMYGVIEAAHLLGNSHAAERAYELLMPYSHLPMTASIGVACFGSVHHALGVASLTVGEPDRAIEHLREAVHRNLALGHWPAVVSSRLRLAEALDQRGEPGDPAGAQDERARADDIASLLGIALPFGAARGDDEDARVATPATLSRQGRRWRVDVGTRSVLVDHSVGMLHLAVLTANPGTEIAAIELVAGVDGLASAVRGTGLSAQAMLDRNAVQGYRQRLAQLGDELADAEARGDRSALARARSERDWLVSELAAGTGLGGRARAFADDGERARLAVGKAIRRALANIESVDPVVGAHLRSGVHTGVRCWYRPH